MKSDLLNLFRAAIAAVDPYRCVKEHFRLTTVSSDHQSSSSETSVQVRIGDQHLTLRHNLYVAAFGKAALGMCRAVNEICPEHIVKGIASVPVGAIEKAKKDGIYPSWRCSIDIYEGAENNLPDSAAMATAHRIQKMISETMCDDDILLVLISGGGSALLPLPIDILSLDEKCRLIKLLQSKGANIQELNTVRQSMSQLKNGGLVRMAKAQHIIAFILSDVIGDPLEFIASAPTFYSGNKAQSALDIIKKYELIQQLPSQLVTHLESQTQLKDDAQQDISSKTIQNLIVGSNRLALEAAAEKCHESLKCPSFIATTSLHGEASDMGRRIIELLLTKPSDLIYNDRFLPLFTHQKTFESYQQFIKEHKRFCLLFGGETTVVMKKEAGKGGRCQELALAAALSIPENIGQISLYLLAAGSDGIDGPTDAAGAFAVNGMINNDQDREQARLALERHDTYTYLNQLHNGEHLLKIGHTNTNVMDIVLVLIDYGC